MKNDRDDSEVHQIAPHDHLRRFRIGENAESEQSQIDDTNGKTSANSRFFYNSFEF
jgi:hypothetical protein